MYIPFNDIDLNSRIWIYQADRQISDHEAGIIFETLKSSVDLWEAHGKPLTASVKLFEHRFVIIAVDERDELPSGCSIDKSSHWLQEIGHQLNIDFFDRSIAYLDNGVIKTIAPSDIKSAVADETIQADTLIFDNHTTTKAQWMSKWKIQAYQSWLQRYFNNQVSI